ncbi:MAG: T9SS type A sorting domain-containing protein [Bacteroidales bacterium]|nr:T9SS type A sorting domain-containing protein [Bacteroidales bacterium]
MRQYFDISDVRESTVNLPMVYPNPFSESTEIRFLNTRKGLVNVSVYDVQGKKITNIANDIMAQGEISLQWNGKTETGTNLSNGLYFIRISTPDNEFKTSIIYSK